MDNLPDEIIDFDITKIQDYMTNEAWETLQQLLSIHTQKLLEVSSVKVMSLECCVLNYCGYSSKPCATHFPAIPWKNE